MIRALGQRLRRLEAALTAPEPHIITITTIEAATGKIIHEGQLVMYPRMVAAGEQECGRSSAVNCARYCDC